MNNLEWLYRNDYEIMGYIDSHVADRCYGGVLTLGEARGWLLSPCEWEDGNTPESHGEATSAPQTVEPEHEPASAENEPQDGLKQSDFVNCGKPYREGQAVLDAGIIRPMDAGRDNDGTCPDGIGQASIDTREKLEDEISEWCASSNAVFARSRFNRIIEWLNRQAAITHELDNVWAKAQQTRIAELTAERDEWQRTAEDYQERKDELTAERDRLRDELAECDENRIEFKEQRDYLQKVVQIQAESFRKLEARLAECSTAEVGDMRERLEMLEAENRELNMRLHGTPF